MNSPEPPDIHSFMEQFNSVAGHLPDVPDWFWKGMTLWAVGWAAGKGIEWTWKHREEFVIKLLRPTPQPITARGGGSVSRFRSSGSKVTVSKDLTTSWNTRSTVGSELRAIWNVEASTSPERLLDEGLELLSWYVRQR